MNTYIAAMQNHWRESEISNRFYGKSLYLVEAPAEARTPYAVLTPISEAITHNTTGYRVASPIVQVSVFTSTASEAVMLNQELRRLFAGADLKTDKEIFMVVPIDARLLKTATQTVDGGDCWMAYTEYELLVLD